MASAPAGAQVTTGRLIGSVVDEAGNPLPGAAVTIASPALIGGARSRAADELAEFAFLNLTPGIYTVRADLEGFDSQEWTRVKVPLGGAAAVTLALTRATFSGELTVVDETPVVDPTQVNGGKVFDEQYIQSSAIGSLNRTYTEVANQAAGVADGVFWGGMAQPRVFGSTFGENAYFVDGVDVTDPLSGTAFVTINFDTIAEIQLQTTGFEAEYGRATGGVLNMVTRSGGNEYSGAVDLRYTDQSFQESGEHLDSDADETSFLRSAITLGGPFVLDRLWFFVSYQRTADRFSPAGAEFTRDSRRQNYLAKLTWQATPDWRLSGRYSTDPEKINDATYSPFVEPEATPHSEKRSTVVATELTAVLTEDLLVGATFGIYRLDIEVVPQSGDLQTIGHHNLDTGVWSRNFDIQQYAANTRHDLTTYLTWFAGELAGDHEIKVGLEYSDFEQTIEYCTTGAPDGGRCVEGTQGFLFEDITNEGLEVPFLMWAEDPLPESTYTGALSSVFVQDAWRATRNLTLKVGLRYDRTGFDNDGGDRIASFDMLQPRLGAAWDLTGDAKNVARASWGRFMHPGALTLPTYVSTVSPGFSGWYSCTGVVSLAWQFPVASAEECASLASDWGWDYRTDHEGWDPLGWVLAPGNRIADSVAVDAGLRPTYADELFVAFEREIGRRSSIGVQYIDKTTRDIYDDTCSGNIPEPAVDAECDVFVVANLAAARRDYRGVVLSYETRGLDWLTLLASYTNSSSKGSVEYTQNRGVEFDLYPWHWVNRYGYLSDHRRHRLKLNGFANLEGDWTVAFSAGWSSPFTWQPTAFSGPGTDIPYGDEYLERRGSREANSNHRLDLQLAKGFTLGRWRLVAIGSVYNALGSERPLRVCARVTGCGTAIEMGDPISWQIPRRYELGFRVEF